MMILIYGGSGSGKSAFAEQRIKELNVSGNNLYYLATMQVFDDEDMERVNRHRKNRADKNFKTIEQPKDIALIMPEMKEEPSDILLECMSNLIANEMFSDGIINGKKVLDKLKKEIVLLNDSCRNFVIVSNNIFEDGIVYEAETMEYINILGDINIFLSGLSDEVWEVVAGIPIRLK
ncbi:MAG: bifunctional adenosylcobinamide kinase/adenosylcobinamide-phosphate guanylyltransferase [Lachnospiraceae bacterium]|nr:bifunctional adenosylcobinamide kinase/adenosylcobinamide-phosphate guanylyltransferase [Lachnospiraceae bacterium]